ncbi:MAG: SDR family NAD(P)-dependent oxidoreductase, partial [Chloroflexi bacterium]|nr:SDR family NAD(P)-dependent oxidoreductase [Chloroflexota bacterium]
MSERVALVTGATGSLGPTVCRTFAATGARLIPVGTNPEKLEALASELALPAAQIFPVVADLLAPDSVAAMVRAARDHFGRLDIWLHMVGGYRAGATVPDFELADLRAMLEQHLYTTLNTARAVTPVMLAAGWGRIVAASATVGQTTPARSAAYNIGKAAQDALMGTLANELRGSGVTANSVVA